MKEPYDKNLIDNLSKLKFIITSGVKIKKLIWMLLKKENCSLWHEININSTPELTWKPYFRLARNKEEIDNMYQGYWQTTVGVDLKGKILGLIGLGKVGSGLLKLEKRLVCRSWHGVKT